MKEHFSNTCETAAIRVQFWFGKDKASLLHASNARLKTQDFCKKYKCDLVASFQIPYRIDQLPLQSYVFLDQKKQVKPRHVTAGNISGSQCSVSQKNLNHVAPECVLLPARVAYNKLKEHFLVSKRLQSFAEHAHSGPKRHQVTSIKTSTQEDLSQNPYLQEWGKFREERHFQIDRVIKFLSD